MIKWITAAIVLSVFALIGWMYLWLLRDLE